MTQFLLVLIFVFLIQIHGKLDKTTQAYTNLGYHSPRSTSLYLHAIDDTKY